MGQYIKTLSIGIALLVAGLIIGVSVTTMLRDDSKKPLVKGNMSMKNPEFVNGGMIPEKYSCLGENINPNFVLENIPSNTKTLAIVAYDENTPSPFLHWMLFDIPAKVVEIPENATFSGSIIGLNDYGKNQYDGPCPPEGSMHKYIFRVYALEMNLGIRNSYSLEAFEKNVRKVQLDYAEYVGYFGR